ncbi:MAG: TolC family protein [Bacteroidetes bacterium]|nr:TolC family protein [Bacteroidota bacterium]
MRKITKLILIVFAFTGTGYAQAQNTYLDSLITEALQKNPQLKSANQFALAQRQRVNQVRSWDPPQVGVEFYQTPISSFPNPFKGGMENDYSIQQMFPFPGKLSAMGNAAENNANMYNSQFKALERKIIKDVKTTYYELYLVERKISLNKENQELLRNFIEIANKQYQVGMGKQPDIIRAQTELSTLINEGINLNKEKVSVEAMLNTLLSRPVNARIKDITEIYSDVPKWTFDKLSNLSYESRNELKAMSYNVEMNKSELRASKLEYYPDIMARLMYKNMVGTSNDFWSAMIGISIPLAPWSQTKFTSKVEENELNIKSAEEQYASMKNMVSYDVQDALVKIESNRNLVELYKNTVIPQAQQTLESTTAAYQTGKTEFLMLIDAYRMLLMVKLDYYMSVMNFMDSQAALEQAVGLTIPEIKEKLQ